MHSLTSAADAAALASRSDSLRQARELYVGSIPPSFTILALIDALNEILLSMGAAVMPGKPIVSGWIGGEGKFAFLEFRTAEECNNALALNGYPLEGQALRVGKPGQQLSAIGSGLMYQSTPFSLDDQPGVVIGNIESRPIEESTKIERLALVGAGKVEGGVLEKIVSEFGVIENEHVVNGTSLLFQFKDVDCQRKCAHQAKHLRGPNGEPLAVIRELDAIRFGFVSFLSEPIVNRVVPTKIVWMTNFPPIAPEHELAKELKSECDTFGEVMIFEMIKRDDMAVVAVVEFESITAAIKCHRYIGSGLTCGYLSQDKFEAKDYSKLANNVEHVHIEKLEEDDIVDGLPKIVDGEVVSVEAELLAQYKLRKKTERIAPEDLEIID
jgi:hypothetical protein